VVLRGGSLTTERWQRSELAAVARLGLAAALQNSRVWGFKEEVARCEAAGFYRLRGKAPGRAGPEESGTTRKTESDFESGSAAAEGGG
jgi:hypothetical protein